MRMLVGLCLALLFIAATPNPGLAQPVSAVFIWEVPPGQGRAVLERLGKVAELANRKDASTYYSSMIAGALTNQILLISEYPSIEAWATPGPATSPNQEMQRLMREASELGAKLVYRGLNADVTPGGSPPHSHQAGSIAFIQIVDPAPGKAGALIDVLGQMAPITKRLEPTSQATIYQTMVGGTASGSIIIFSEYPSAEVWAANRARIRESPDLQKLFPQMPELTSGRGSNMLWTNVTPD